MSRKLKVILTVAVLAILAAAWTWRYVTIIAYYETLQISDTTQYYSLGEYMPVGPDEDDFGNDHSSTKFRVNSWELVEYDEYMAETGLTVNYSEHAIIPEKLVLASVTVKNEAAEAVYYSLYSINLKGTGSTGLSFNEELLSALNPEHTVPHMMLEPNVEYTVLIPFGLDRVSFNGWTWHHLEDYNFSIRSQLDDDRVYHAVKLNG